MKKTSLTKLLGLPSFASHSQRSIFSALVLGCAVTLFASCSGTGTNPDEKDLNESAQPLPQQSSPQQSSPQQGSPQQGSKELAESAKQDSAQIPIATAQDAKKGEGSQDTVVEQRRKFLLSHYKTQARNALADRRFEDAKYAAAEALRVDPSDDEAKLLLQKANALSGDATASVGEQAKTSMLRAEIEKQKAESQARKYERDGNFMMEQQDFEKARQFYEKALLTVTYSPWFTPGSEKVRTLRAKMEQAEKARDEFAQRIAERKARETREELVKAERAEAKRTRAKVRKLFDQANLAFQNRQYGESVTYLDRALLYDPLNAPAQELRELALRARQDRDMASVNARWRSEWVKTFEDINQGNVMQEKVIEHDLRHWEKVKNRKPLEFTNWSTETDPDNEAVLKTLANVRVPSDFPEATIDEWVDYYRRATRLTFVISPRLRELDEEQTGLSKFLLPLDSVEKALNRIMRIRPAISWKVKDGVVYLLSSEESSGDIVTKIYDIQEITSQITHYPGKDLAQKFGEDGDPGDLDEEEDVSIVMDMDTLQTLISNNVAPESWEREGVSIEPADDKALIINQSPEVHAMIDRLLADLRKTSGIQVDIEARFLQVEDNFLEEVGVDFRGLGDQSSAGKAGMGLQKQGDRSGFGFDDYGRDVSSASPGRTGTGFEPGWFYNDGRDGDIYGRTENLFDRALGGSSRLDAGGGASLQYAFLDDAELEVILRAVSKKERVEQLSAPRLLIHNSSRANLTVTNQFTYIKDFNVEIAQNAAIADPEVGIIRDGVVLDVRPVVSADQRFILMELRPTLARLSRPITTFTTSLGAGQPVSIQLPVLQLQRVRTTVTIPDGGTLLLGGMKQLEKQRFESSVPILGDLPLISFFFKKKGVFTGNKKVLILLRAQIVVPSEWEPKAIDIR
ncbi:MAG: hypothetical protein CSA62_10370 [Planctomycetota bacterium]|nr:MAG: hypothetical protein CSA62_10370 [Planctomycetota bacterium]